MIAFWACIRFSACWKTTELSASRTSSVHSKPRSAGKQCMKMAFGVRAIISPLTWKPWKSFLRCSASCFWPMDAQTSE